MAVGAVIGKHNMAKHFAIEIADTTFAFARKTAAIAAEAALDGLYAVRTSLPATALDDSATVKSYKSLALRRARNSFDEDRRSARQAGLPLAPRPGARCLRRDGSFIEQCQGIDWRVERRSRWRGAGADRFHAFDPFHALL